MPIKIYFLICCATITWLASCKEKAVNWKVEAYFTDKGSGSKGQVTAYPESKWYAAGDALHFRSDSLRSRGILLASHIRITEETSSLVMRYHYTVGEPEHLLTGFLWCSHLPSDSLTLSRLEATGLFLDAQKELFMASLSNLEARQVIETKLKLKKKVTAELRIKREGGEYQGLLRLESDGKTFQYPKTGAINLGNTLPEIPGIMVEGPVRDFSVSSLKIRGSALTTITHEN